MSTRRRRQPAYGWQTNPLFAFFSSVRLAILLLSVLIVASIIGTIYESSFDAKVARHYIYNAPWFNAWLLLLALNLACAAFSRLPWQRHHTGFLITHLGIIILLAGSWIGRTWGIEGTMTLFKGEPANHLLLVDEKVLQVSGNGSISRPVPVEMLDRKRLANGPRPVTSTPDGWGISITDYSPTLELDMTPKALPSGGVPAIHIHVSTAMMGQKLDSWLLADDPTNGVFSMGLAAVTLKRGTAPGVSAAAPKPAAAAAAEPAAAEPVEVEEAIFAFAKAADQVAKALKGGSTGARVKLEGVEKGNAGTLVVDYQGATRRIPVAENLNKEIPLEGSALTLMVKNYWPDFRIRDGAPASVSDEPNNPAVLVMLRGKAVPASPAAATAEHAMGSESGDAQNSLTLYVDANHTFTYELSSRRGGKSSGTLELNKELATGWADWVLVIDQALPHAEEHFTARPITAEAAASTRHTEGVRVRATKGAESAEEWIPLGWQIALGTTPPLRVSYGFRQAPLPIALQLKDFEVERNEGTDTPAGFKSTLEITAIDGTKASGQCWMNNPISFPASWINTWSGFTYKISQASWNPENLSQSSVQILRDPGWGLKWIGSLLVCCGVFTMFYLRPYPKDLNPVALQPVTQRQPARELEEPVEV